MSPPHGLQRIPTPALFKILRDPLNQLVSIHKLQGDLAEFRFGRFNVLLVGHPSLVKEVLIDKQESFIKSRTMRMGKELMGEGLPATEGRFHRDQRKFIQPAFSHAKIDRYLEVIDEYASMHVGRWQEGVPLRIREEMMRLTLSMVVRVLFGADIRGESTKVQQALVDSLDHFVGRYYMRIFYFDQDRNPIAEALDLLPTPGNLRYNRALDSLDEAIARIVSSRIASRVAGDDLLSHLLGSPGFSGEPRLSQRQVHDELMTFMLAGHDTTATALAWTLYLLDRNPEVEARLQEELRSVIGDFPIVPADYGKLSYTRKVVKESMRLYPPAWIIGREAVKNCSIGGVPVAKGTTVLMSQYVIHHDERFYADPERFNPARWTPEMEKTLPPFAYFPFGGGLRGCVGEPLALAMAVTILAEVERHWKLSKVPGTTVSLRPRVTLHPKGDITMLPLARSPGKH